MNKTGEGGGPWEYTSLDDKRAAAVYRNFNTGLATHIIEVFKPQSILEFGSGLGLYCNFYSENGAAIVHGIEPHGPQENFSDGPGNKLFNFDITCQEIPPEIQKSVYDLVISIEVLEHIDLRYHDRVFDFFVEKANKFIIFSGGHPGQAGIGHIACRPEEEWRNEFIKRGFLFEREHTTELRKASNKRNINHRKNLQVFSK